MTTTRGAVGVPRARLSGDRSRSTWFRGRSAAPHQRVPLPQPPPQHLGRPQRPRLRHPRWLPGHAGAHAGHHEARRPRLVLGEPGGAARRFRSRRGRQAPARRGGAAARWLQRRLQRRRGGGADGDAPTRARHPAAAGGHGRSARGRAACDPQQGELQACGASARDGRAHGARLRRERRDGGGGGRAVGGLGGSAAAITGSQDGLHRGRGAAGCGVARAEAVRPPLRTGRARAPSRRSRADASSP